MFAKDLNSRTEYLADSLLYIRPGKAVASQWAVACKDLHTSVRRQERRLGISKPQDALLKLHVNGLNHDQIWEQVNLNDEHPLSLETPSDLNTVKYNLCVAVESLRNASAAPQLLKDCAWEQLDEEDVAHLTKKPRRRKESGEPDSESEEEDEEEEYEDESSSDEDKSVSQLGGSEFDTSDEEQESVDDGDDGAKRLLVNGDKVDSEDNEEVGENNKINNSESHGSSDDSDDDDAYEEIDKQLFDKYKRHFNDDEDDDSDTYGNFEDLKVGSDEDDSSSDDDEVQKVNSDGEEDGPRRPKQRMEEQFQDRPKSKGKPFQSRLEVPQFSKCDVDTRFFNVRESEWMADQDVLGSTEFSGIDFMQGSDEDDTDEQDDADGAKYDDFFDAPTNEGDNRTPTHSSSRKASKKTSRRASDSSEASQDGSEDEEDWASEVEEGSEDTEEEDENMTVTTPAAPAKEEKPMSSSEQSRLQRELAEEAQLRGTLEESNANKDKPWLLSGEVMARERPVNSTLHEYLDFKTGTKQKPIVSATLIAQIERVIVGRCRTKAYDSVERRAKPDDDPFEYKKKLVLDQEKSTKSLSKIYEEEYQRAHRVETARKEKEELPEHKELRKAFNKLARDLDALSNAHYTPIAPKPEIQIKSNMPSIRMEEATPIAMADADTLAPEEILAPSRGPLKGASEKTATDRNRDRRAKKSHQSQRHKLINKKLDNKIKLANKSGKRLDIATSAKVVKRAIKIGQVKLMDQDSVTAKSSTSFFQQLQEKHAASTEAAQQRKRKRDDRR